MVQNITMIFPLTIDVRVTMKEEIIVSGGPGNRPDNAWVLEGGAPDLTAEPIKRKIISQTLGPIVKNWKPVAQHRFSKQGRIYEELEIEIQDGQKRSLFFDVTNYRSFSRMAEAS